jgi:hypothetical protein
MSKHGTYLLSSLCKIAYLHAVPILANTIRIIPIYLVRNWNTILSYGHILHCCYTFSWTEAKYITYFVCKGDRKRTLRKPKHGRKETVKTDGQRSRYSNTLQVGRFAIRNQVGKINCSLFHNHPERLRGPTQIPIQYVTGLLLGGIK